MTANIYMTMTKINVKFPSAPIVEIIMLNRTFIVVHDCANFNTRNCQTEIKKSLIKNTSKRIEMKMRSDYSLHRIKRSNEDEND